MKKLIVASLLSVIFSGCIKDSSLYTGGPENQKEIDPLFSFATRSEHNLSLTALSPMGKPASTVLFGIYLEDPFLLDENGDSYRNSNVKPIFQGFTDKSGVLNANVSVPMGTKELYVLPETSGFGQMKTVDPDQMSGLTFQGATFGNSSSRSVGSRAVIEREYKSSYLKGNNSRFYSYYNDDEFKYNGSENPPEYFCNGIVSYEELSGDVLEYFNSNFPEGKDNYTGDTETDLYVSEDNAEIWVTYVGTNVDVNVSPSPKSEHSALYFYTYTSENKPIDVYSQKYFAVEDYHFAAVFPDINAGVIPIGTKVQLLYYNRAEKKYQSNFPKGTYIGFAYLTDGFRILKSGKYQFQYSFNYNLDNATNPYCSTIKCNADKTSHAVCFYNPSYNGYILGMEKKGNDRDYNDVMCILQTDENKVKPVGNVTPIVAPAPVINDVQQGILTFEDNWPSKGDYDFNDFITSYSYTLNKGTDNNVSSITLSFTPKAIGATYANGFGIQLPIATSNIVSVSGADKWEQDEQNATLIVYDNVRSAFNGASGFINTLLDSPLQVAVSKEITIELKTPVSAEGLLAKFNPFLFVGERSREIHLSGFKATSKMDISLFGSKDDGSDASKDIYYRSDNKFPWALDISDMNWKWCYESESNGIEKAYPLYSKWYENYMDTSFNWVSTVSEEYLWKAQ